MKKSPIKAAVDAVAAAQPQALPTRCDGPEIDVGIVPLHQGEPVNLRVVLCESAFRVRVHLDGKVIFDQSGLKDQVDILLPPLSPGFHSLTWSFLAASDPWHTRSEVQVSDLVRFALNKGSDSSVPSNNLAVILQVI
ncbi:MAG TPA: hypothetical protein VN783_06230 [Thermoanaerobaculia bacterium]|nr:hypothetical protein [Thermoanaerobaculia bacterium]